VGRIGHIAAPCTAVLAVVLLLSGCALAGRTFGTYVDDTSITGGVKVRLASLHLSHLKRVNVDVYGRVVYLTGTVKTAEEKSDAEIAAWRTDGVEQVVNDIVVRERPIEAVSALPDMRPRHPLMGRFTWIARVEPGGPGRPDLAYDAEGRLAATIYTVASRALVDAGVATLAAAGRPIDHVSLYPVPVREDLPEPLLTVVLWHLPERATTR
jgi:hyperosmotically inducible periplasmic protein